MKNKKFKILIFGLLAVLMFGMFPNFSSNSSRAAIVEDNFSDTALVGALKDLYKEVIGEDLVTIRDNTFNREEFTNINLNREGKANKISRLSGLEKLDFDYAVSIDLGGNLIEDFTKDNLSGFNKDILSSIDLSQNNLTSFDIVTDTDSNSKDFKNIKFLDLSGNRLNSVNLTQIINGGDNQTEAIVDLSDNKINSAEDIKISKSLDLKLSLNLVGNNIYNSDKIARSGLTMVLGNQGTKDVEKLTTSTIFNYTKTNFNNIYLTFHDKLLEQPLPDLKIGEEALENNSVDYTLGVGNYEIKYIYDADKDGVHDNILPDDLSLFEKNILNINQSFIINFTKPSYVFIVDGKEKDSVKHISGYAIIKVESIDNAKIMYKYGYEDEWREGNEIKLDRGGSYSVKLKVVNNNFESEEVFIEIKSSVNPKIPDVILIIIAVGIFLIMMFIIFPLLGKYFVKR